MSMKIPLAQKEKELLGIVQDTQLLSDAKLLSFVYGTDPRYNKLILAVAFLRPLCALH